MDLSIIIPAYNCELLIEKCIQSILSEADENVEIIVIDDGSSDNTLDVCLKYEGQNFHAYHKENGGVSSARNKGLELSSGKYVMFVDADDTLLPGWYSTVYRYLSNEYQIVFFGSDFKCDVYTKEEVVSATFGLPASTIQGLLASVWSKVYLRTYIIENGIKFDSRIINGEDLLFSLQASLHAERYKFVRACIYNYFSNAASATHTFQTEYVDSNRLFLIKAERLLEDSTIPRELAGQCIKYSFINGLVILLVRLSYLEAKERRAKFRLFKDPYIRLGIKKYRLGMKEFGLPLYICYTLITVRLYGLASFLLGLRIKRSINKNNTI